MRNRTRVAVTLVVIVGILGLGLLSTPSRGQGPDNNAEEFIQLMDKYLGLSDRFVAMASKKATAVYLAVEGITEIYENRGEKAKAIPHLERILDKHADSQAVRNVIRFKLRDLYNETGRSDKALEELDQIIEENE